MEPYDSIAAYYDLEHETFTDDVELFRQMLYEGPVLEIGVGTGRIAAALAQDGLEVWGVDRSEAMLARAQGRAGSLSSLHLVQSDVRDLGLGRRFRAAIFPLNGLWHLPDCDAQLDALSAIGRHLEEDGLFVVDTSNPHAMDDLGQTGHVRVRFRAALEGDEVTGYSAAWDDAAEQRLTLDLWYDRVAPDGRVRRQAGRLVLRYLYRAELELLLRLAGFRVEHVYGSYALERYCTTSERLLMVARLA